MWPNDDRGHCDKTITDVPANANEREIKRRVDLKARTIVDGTGSWHAVVFKKLLQF